MENKEEIITAADAEYDDDEERLALLSDSAGSQDEWNEGIVTMYQEFLARMKGDIMNGRFR